MGLEPTTARLRAARSTDWARKATNETYMTYLFFQYYTITIIYTKIYIQYKRYIKLIYKRDIPRYVTRWVTQLCCTYFPKILCPDIFWLLACFLLFPFLYYLLYAYFPYFLLFLFCFCSSCLFTRFFYSPSTSPLSALLACFLLSSWYTIFHTTC